MKSDLENTPVGGGGVREFSEKENQVLAHKSNTFKRIMELSGHSVHSDIFEFTTPEEIIENYRKDNKFKTVLEDF